MIYKKNVILVFLSCFLLAGCTSSTVSKSINDPSQAKFYYEDISNFWRAFDLAEDLEDERSLPVFDGTYFKQASKGLKDFWGNYELDKGKFVKTIRMSRNYFKAARNNSLSAQRYEKRFTEIFYKLKSSYPKAKFPDVYFIIGGFKSGGTISSRALIIGMEFWSLPQNKIKLPFEWMEHTIRGPQNIPFTLAHELIHFQQGRKEFPKTLLGRSLTEGGADFLGKLISGGINNEYLHKYANQRERQLWLQFKEDMKTNDQSRWIYNLGTIKDIPADLGYYIGYKICESYYNNAKDKTQAVRTIINISDPIKFLIESRYSEKFR